LGRLLRFMACAIAGAAVALAGTAIIVFAAIHMVPGGYAEAVLPTTASPQERAAFTHRYGLDKPLPVQFEKWAAAMLRGDLGTDLQADEPIRAEVVQRAPATIELTILATLMTLLIGIPLGAIAALRARGLIAPVATRAAASLALAIPSFVLGTAVVYLASLHLPVLSLGVYVPFTSSPGTNLSAMWLPSLVLAVGAAGLFARATRDAVLNVLTQPFITAAVARGESPVQIVRRHVLRNSAAPLVVLTAVLVGSLLGGVVFIEDIFSIPGLGQYALNAIETRNYSQVEAVVVLGTLVFIVFSLLADVAQALIDPRISLSGRSS
jgi:peptide/nickel transport system permease protein